MTESLESLVKEARRIAEQCDSLDTLKKTLRSFQGHPLSKTSNTVFGRGSASFGMMVIGEAPGITENERKKPAMGESGYLLDAMLRSIKCEPAYHSNVMYWRPPGNRQPTPEEIAICKPFVEKHIALVKPKLLILLGTTARKALLGIAGVKTFGPAQYFNQYLSQNIPAFPIYHPAYILRCPEMKPDYMKQFTEIEKFVLERGILV